ncbi:MAG: DUF5063 domain-containing protein [Bacteroidales bacterium]|nr:DUF5063 domain-containing protein [Bacteroidales bacterium]
MEEENKILYSEEVLEFVRLSKEYCTLLETPLEMEQDEFIRFSLYALPAIYSAMIRLPQVESIFEEASEKFVTEQDWSEVYRKISAIMEGNNDFLDIPSDEEFDRSELITRKISEDMSDIYQDLRDFLEIYRSAPEEVMNDALWECQNNFLSFWGAKSLRVAASLHKLYSGEGKKESFPDESGTDAPRIDTRNWFISKRQEEYQDPEDEFFT